MDKMEDLINAYEFEIGCNRSVDYVAPGYCRLSTRDSDTICAFAGYFTLGCGFRGHYASGCSFAAKIELDVVYARRAIAPWRN